VKERIKLKAFKDIKLELIGVRKSIEPKEAEKTEENIKLELIFMM
jgi:hypothetical protein